MVPALLERFPGAKIVYVRARADEAAAEDATPVEAILGEDAPAAIETEEDDDLDF